MIEFPESHTLARQITDTLAGRRIESAIAGASPHGFAFFTGEPAAYADRLKGKKVEGATAQGGWVELSLGEDCLSLFDGVNPRYLAPGSKEPAKHQLYIVFEDGGALMATIQMYGGIQLYRAGENNNPYYLVAREKPSPLSDAFDEAYFEGLLTASKPTLSAKAFLATEQRIPGLGNGVLQDILFLSRIHPKRKLNSLSDTEKSTLYHTTRDTLSRMTQQGGRDVEKDLYGKPGGYATLLSSKTWKSPCPVCGGEIQRQAYLGGNVYVCPHCQPL